MHISDDQIVALVFTNNLDLHTDYPHFIHKPFPA